MGIMLARIIRLAIGLLLVPVCIAATMTLYSLLTATQSISPAVLPPAAWALAGGFLLWVFLFLTLPRPVRSYVLAHEMTHALWAWLTGAEVRGLRVSEDRGSVTVSRNNFLITLAPYFFPLYTVLTIAAYYILSVFYDISGYQLFWLAAVGFTWGFHFTFTLLTLLQRQSDIHEYGRVFSYAVIYLFNVLGVCLWVVIVSSPTLEQMVNGLGESVAAIAALCRGPVRRFLDLVGQ